MNFRTLKPDEIDIRIGQVGNGYFTLLLYKDARADMNILDEMGLMWQRRHYEVKGNLFCSVGIYYLETKEWAWRDDCGIESRDDGTDNHKKGEASDSFKRACVNWGIGRELYTSPRIKVNCSCKKGDKEYQLPYLDYTVSHIAYNDKREISELNITAKTRGDWKAVEIFTFSNGFSKTIKEDNPAPPQKEARLINNSQVAELESLKTNFEALINHYKVKKVFDLTYEQAEEALAAKRRQYA